MYIHYNVTPNYFLYFILLNGIIQANCLEADDCKGFITRSKGKLKKKIEQNATEIIYGRVEIIPVYKLANKKKYEVHL